MAKSRPARGSSEREPMNLPKTSVIEPDALPTGADDENYDESDDSRPEGQVVIAQKLPDISPQDLARAQVGLAGAVQALVDAQPVKRVPWSKFKTRSPFNPTGNKKRKLTRRVYQNGFPVNIKKLFDEEIAMLNKLEPGKYMDGIVTVYQATNGGNTDLHIVYNNKSYDQRLALSSHFRNLKEMLQNCLDEQAARGKTIVTV